MNARHWLLGAVLLGSVSLCRAEEVVEVARSAPLFSSVTGVAVDPSQGSCLVGDYFTGRVLRLDQACSLEWTYRNTGPVQHLAVNTSDGSCWAIFSALGTVPDRLIHVAADGAELLALERFWSFAVSIDVDPNDGSIWVADISRYEVEHLAADGTELFWSDRFDWPSCIAVDPADGSCWVGDWANVGVANEPDKGTVVHLAADGTELLRVEGFGSFSIVGASPRDGSCWVTVRNEDLIVHLAGDGTELWRWALEKAGAPAVNSADGSCWVRGEFEVLHLAPDGTELYRGVGFRPCAVDPVDGSIWALDETGREMMRLMIPGWRPPVFFDVPPYSWAFEQVEACYNAGIVGGFPDGLYRPSLSVTRDQMAVFISRAIAGGDDNVPFGPQEASFSDVPPDHWAYKHVEYCLASGIVEGFSPDTYEPDTVIARDAMAVFISRAMLGGDENVPDGPAEATFEDVPTDHWAYRHIEYCVDQAIVQGYDPVTYSPEIAVSRDQMAVFISRAFELPCP